MGISPEEVLENRKAKLGVLTSDMDLSEETGEDMFERERMDYARVLREEIEILSAVGVYQTPTQTLTKNQHCANTAPTPTPTNQKTPTNFEVFDE